MCFGIPMKIKAIEGYLARCEAKGVEREVNLIMMQGIVLQVGDFVVVDRGYAIQQVTMQEAAAAWELYNEMLAAEQG